MKGEDLSFSGGQPSRLKKLWDVARRNLQHGAVNLQLKQRD